MSPGEAFRAHRLRLGLTQQQLAREAGVSVRALRDLERGRVGRPRGEILARLSTVLELSTRERKELLVAAGLKPPANGPLTVAVLGPLSATRGGVSLRIPSAIQRILLSFLALQPGYSAPVDEIAEVLWSGHPSASWRNLIHVHVNRLRSILEPARDRRAVCQTLVSTNGAYRLELPPDHHDVLRFDRAIAEARRASQNNDRHAACLLYEQALECWRGPVLAGGDDRVRLHPAAHALNRRRIEGAAAHADTAFACGRYAQAKHWLQELSYEEPLNESLHAQLMIALAGSGEQAAAMRVYTEMRTRLSEQLGVDPGPEMRAAYGRVLDWASTADPVANFRPVPSARANSLVPLQVPATVAVFHGRDRELAWLDRIAESSGAQRVAPVVGIISGTAGVGKTALAAHWAHRTAAAFPDGQLYVDLRGFDIVATPMEATEALRYFLRALGVAPTEIPGQEGEAAALFRSLLAGRQMLVVLDNARSAEQIRPLLPGTAGCTALVTSRNRLAGLVASHDARSLELDILGADQAVELLRQLLGGRAGDTEATAGLAKLCAYLPLALRIAAANLTCQPHLSIGEYAAKLSGGDGLSALAAHDDQRYELKATFSLSYEDLQPAARRLFRLLHLIPGPELGAEAAAALLGEQTEPTHNLLRRLCDGHILTEPRPRRFALHDLLRQYSHACGGEEESAAGLAQATRRLVDFYSLAVYDAYPLMHARRNETPRALRYPPPQPLRFADRDSALAWHDLERENLVGIVRLAAEHGWHEPVWQLADGLFAYFNTRRLWPEWLSVLGHGLESARRLGDGEITARMHNALGVVNKQTGRYEQAHTHYLAALEHATAARHRRLVAAAHVNLGGLLVNQGDPTGAVRHLRTALADPDYGGEPAYATVTYLNYGCALLELGVPDEATRALTEAMSLATRANDPLNACHAHHGLAELHLRTGDLPTAVHHAQQELDLAIRMGDPLRHAAALDILASCLAPDDLDAARHRWSEALEIYRSLDHRLQYPLHHWLDGLDNAAAATDFAQRDAVRRGRARKMI